MTETFAALGLQNHEAVHEKRECKLSGEFPSWLSGVLYRSGPGTFTVDDTKTGKQKEFRHWFDGLQRIHRFEISQGKVFYSSRGNVDEYQSKLFINNPSELLFWGDQRDPCVTVFSRYFQTFKALVGQSGGISSGDDNINVVPHVNFPASSDDLLITTDASMVVFLDKQTLITKQQTSYGKLNPKLRGVYSASHYQQDEVTGEVYNYVMDVTPNAPFQPFMFSKSHPQGKAFDSIKGAPASYCHSFGLTQKYVVYILTPWRVTNGLKILYERSMCAALKWFPEEQTKFLVVDRQSGKHLGTYECASFFFFHSINAYDDADDIVIDLCGYNDPSINDALYISEMRKPEIKHEFAQFRRYRLPKVSELKSPSDAKIAQKSAQSNPIAVSTSYPMKMSVELPRLNPSFANKPYRYMYAVGQDASAGSVKQIFDCIVKVDTHALIVEGKGDAAAKYFIPDKGGVPAEPVFVAKPDGAEDEGALISVILDPSGESYMVVIDAQSMKEVARAWLGTVMAYNFHGVFEAGK